MTTRLAPSLTAALAIALVLPAYADEDTQCRSALKHASELNASQPIEVDSATHTTAAMASCADMALVVTRQIDLKHSRMEADFKDFLRKQITDHACAQQTEAELIKSGWDVRYQNVFNDGPIVKITVSCPE